MAAVAHALIFFLRDTRDRAPRATDRPNSDSHDQTDLSSCHDDESLHILRLAAQRPLRKHIDSYSKSQQCNTKEQEEGRETHKPKIARILQ